MAMKPASSPLENHSQGGCTIELLSACTLLMMHSVERAGEVIAFINSRLLATTAAMRRSTQVNITQARERSTKTSLNGRIVSAAGRLAGMHM